MRSNGIGIACRILALLLCNLFCGSAWCQDYGRVARADRYARFSTDLDEVRNLLHVPGMAAAIVEGNRVVWRQDFGFADAEKQHPVGPDTEFCIASVSKTMAAVILMQLRDAGMLGLDDPVSKYLTDSGMPANITIREVMSHTSDGAPGEEFLYNGARYAALSQIIEKLTGKPYAAVLSDRILRPLKMAHTIPGLDAPGYEVLQQQLAKPYDWDADSSGGIKQGELPRPGLSAATGIVSTEDDLALYAMALDGSAVASPRSKTAMFTPTRSSRGENLPYGLGWFVQDYMGEKLVWHFGQEDSYASLFLRVPERKLTVIVLANSNALSDAFRLLDGNAARSLVALDFLKDVVLSDKPLDAAAQGQLEADHNLDEALARIYLNQRDQAVPFARRALDAGTVQLHPDVSTLYLLMRLNERTFNGATEAIGTELGREHPNLPTALFYFGTFYEQTDRPEKAMPLFQRIADIQPPLRHWTAALALLELGKWYSGRNPDQARKYLRRVIEMNLNVEGAVDRAQQALKVIPQL